MSNSIKGQNVGLTYGWKTGDLDWGDPINMNFLMLDALSMMTFDDFIVSLNNIDTQNGVYIISDDSITDTFIGKLNYILIKHDDDIIYIQPKSGMILTNQKTNIQYQYQLNSWINITNHAVSTSSYGIASSSVFGHVKIVNDLSTLSELTDTNGCVPSVDILKVLYSDISTTTANETSNTSKISEMSANVNSAIYNANQAQNIANKAQTTANSVNDKAQSALDKCTELSDSIATITSNAQTALELATTSSTAISEINKTVSELSDMVESLSTNISDISSTTTTLSDNVNSAIYNANQALTVANAAKTASVSNKTVIDLLSVTSGENKIPQADENGKLDSSWFPSMSSGDTSGLIMRVWSETNE